MSAPSSSEKSACSARSLALLFALRLNASTSSAAVEVRIEVERHTPQWPANAHLASRRRGRHRAVVIGEDGVAVLAHEAEQALREAARRPRRANVAELRENLREDRAAEAVAAAAKVDEQELGVPASVRSCGVAPRTSSTGAKAETTSDSGATTSLPSQAVRIDRESFPTGIDTPSAGQSSSATALTVS